MKKYKATGTVIGNCWGGGKVGYAAEEIEAATKEELIATANKMLEDGSLDSGMGFESLTGAIFDVEEIEEVEVEGKTFTRSEFEFVTIGNVTEEEFRSIVGG